MTVLTTARPEPDATLVVPVCDDDATVAGEFDLRSRLELALAARPAVVVVDLGGCHYLDAPGLRVLVEARDRASAQGTRLRLQSCSPEVLRLLDAAGHPVDLWTACAGRWAAPRSNGGAPRRRRGRRRRGRRRRVGRDREVRGRPRRQGERRDDRAEQGDAGRHQAAGLQPV